MRGFTLGLVCGLVALAGFAGSASASATLDLIWSNATNTFDFPSSGDTSTLSVILTAGPLGTIGGGVTVDYSGVASFLDVTGFTVTAFTMPLPFNIGATADTGTMVTNINAAGGLGFNQTLLNGASFLLGTVTFQRIAPVTGGEITVGFTGTDHLIAGDGTGAIIDGTVIRNSAFAPVPEPGTISLLGMGLGGLYVVGRRSSRKR